MLSYHLDNPFSMQTRNPQDSEPERISPWLSRALYDMLGEPREAINAFMEYYGQYLS
jgi:hypothetical protein